MLVEEFKWCINSDVRAFLNEKEVENLYVAARLADDYSLTHKVNKPFPRKPFKVSKDAKIRNRYNQVPHLTQDTNGKVTNSQLDTTNKSQEVSPFPAGDHKAQINRRAQRHSKHKTGQNIKDPQKKYCLGTVSKIFHWRA